MVRQPAAPAHVGAERFASRMGMTPSPCIYIAGYRGMVGSAIVRRPRAAGHGTPLLSKHAELDKTNVIHAAWLASVKRLLFLGTSCIYPKLAPQFAWTPSSWTPPPSPPLRAARLRSAAWTRPRPGCRARAPTLASSRSLSWAGTFT